MNFSVYLLVIDCRSNSIYLWYDNYFQFEMILQVITPEKETFDLTVSLPESYLGKEVHCLFYIEEEAKNVSLKSPTVKKPSEFFGILNTEEGDQFNKHIQKLRNEWDRSI